MVCITTVADGDYQGYIPLYLHCLQAAYPEYDVLVFVIDRPRAELERGLAVLEPGSYRVVYDGFKGKYKPDARLAANLRYLLFTPERVGRFFADYDVVYITDADLLIVREEPTLAEQHLAHCKALGLPYSNLSRNLPKGHLTGLHFATREYIERVADTVERVDAIVQEQGLQGLGVPGQGADEWLLYYITSEAGVGLPPKHDGRECGDPASCGEVFFRPWHGLNLGYAVPGDSERRVRQELLVPYIRCNVAVLKELARREPWDALVESMPAAGQAALKLFFAVHEQMANG